MDVENNATTDSLRDDLAAAFGGADDTSSASATTTDDTTATSSTQAAAERTRDEQGRFTRAQQEAADAAAQQQVKTDQQQQQSPAQAKKAPQSWKQELKSHFDTLPPEVQDEVLRRETDYSKGIQKYAEGAKFADSFRPVVEQWAPYLSQIQATPESAFQALITTEYTLRTGSPSQKQQMLMTLAKEYGIEIGGQSADTQGQQQHASSPDLQHAVQRVQQLEQYIQNIEYERQQQAARQQQAETAELTQQINAFASSGNAPHYQEVSQDMAQLLKAGYANDLQDAYEKACWARPDIRASLLKSEEAKRIQEKAELANKAKGKATSITGSPSGASVPVPGASIRADLEAAWGGANRI